ncbi:MAG: chromosome segregation protein SMC, partial [Oscillospiraceae bacterium]|nr:chromosome segregation protein SMC [Oscillospiraceae bacterium]
MQVTPLKKQAETAKKYLVLRDEQRELEINVWMEELDACREKSERAAKDLEEANVELARARRELDELYAANDNFSNKMHECDIDAERERGRLSEEEASAAECENAIAVLKTNLRHNEETIDRLHNEIDEQSERAENIRSQVQSHKDRISGIDEELAEKQLSIRAFERDAEALAAESDVNQQELSRLIACENEANEALAAHRATIAQLCDRAAEISERSTTIASDIEDAEARYDEVSKSYHEARREAEKAEERYNEINNIINGHRMLMGGREKKVQELTEKLNKLSVEKRSTEGRIKLLTELEQEFEGLGKAVKNVMRARSHGTLKGIHGPVAGLISVADKYTVAIETALGAAMQNIVVDSQDVGKAAIEMLKRSDGGRTTFLPLDTVKPNSLSKVPSGEDGFVAVASQLVKSDDKYTALVANLLGRTVIVETLADAVRISRKNGNSLRIVTLDGQMINAGGSMTGGSSAKNVGILSRANELKSLKEKLVRLAKDEEKQAAELEEASRELEKARYELQVASSELNGAAEEFRRTDSNAERLKMMQSALDESIEALETERAGLSGRKKENLLKQESEKSALAAQEKRLEQLKAEIKTLSAGHEDFELKREKISEKISVLRA